MTITAEPPLAPPPPIDSLQATLPLRQGATRPSTPNPNSPSEQSPLNKADIVRDDLTGLAFGPYILGPKLGSGGMGTIFLARHVQLNREFALKLISADATHSAEASLRFDQEVKALGQLQHPNIVSAVDAGTIAGVQYLVTERIQGQDLWQIVKWRGALSIADACEMIRQAALGLAYSHSCGIFHRDIKPSNLIVDQRGVVKILDFGLVRKLDSEQMLTMDGVVLGTLDFIAPEQAQDARSADQRSDLYSLGCTLVYLLSGHPPYHGVRYATPASKIKGHLLDSPDWLKHASTTLPAPLLATLRRLLAKDPASRIATAQEVADRLAPFCHDHQLTQLFNADTNQATPSAQVSSTSRQHPTTAASRRSWAIGISAALAVLLLVSVGTIATWHIVATNTTAKQPQPSPPEPTATITTLPVEPAPTPEPARVAAPPPAEQPTPVPAIAEHAPTQPTTTVTVNTSQPKQTVNASAIPFKFSAPAHADNFQPLSQRVTDKP